MLGALGGTPRWSRWCRPRCSWDPRSPLAAGARSWPSHRPDVSCSSGHAGRRDVAERRLLVTNASMPGCTTPWSWASGPAARICADQRQCARGPDRRPGRPRGVPVPSGGRVGRPRRPPAARLRAAPGPARGRGRPRRRAAPRAARPGRDGGRLPRPRRQRAARRRGAGRAPPDPLLPAAAHPRRSTGLDLADGQDRLRLHLALTLAPLVGEVARPDGPSPSLRRGG